MVHDRSCDEGYADFYHEEYVLNRLERQEKREKFMAKQKLIRVTNALANLVSEDIAKKSFLEDEKLLNERAESIADAIYRYILPNEFAKAVEKMDKHWFYNNNTLVVVLGAKGGAVPVLSFKCKWSTSRKLPHCAQYGNFEMPLFGQTASELAIYEEADAINNGRLDLIKRRDVIRAQTFSFLSQFHSFNQVFNEWSGLKALLSADVLKKVEPVDVMALPALVTENFIDTLAKAGVPPKVKEVA